MTPTDASSVDWLKLGPFIQALAVVFAACIARNIAKTYQGAQVKIEERQARAAEIKLKADLFQLRYSIYQEIMTIFEYFYLAKHIRSTEDELQEKLSNFWGAINKAKIVFSPDVNTQLVDVGLAVAIIRSDYMRVKDSYDDQDKHKEHVDSIMKEVIKLQTHQSDLDAAFIQDLIVPSFETTPQSDALHGHQRQTRFWRSFRPR